MNNWTVEEISFRCARLFIRMERLAQNFSRMGSLSLEGVDPDAVLEIIRESKLFLELTAIDLDVDSAVELAAIQRQLSRWHVHWLETWASDTSQREISTLSLAWTNRIREIAGVFV
jgi:hypothetical protein